MKQKDREREIRRRLYEYASYRREIAEYVDSVINATPVFDESGVHGSGISDPTARAGVALASLPAHLEVKKKWVDAVNEALDELREMDGSDTRGYVYICTRMYGLNARRRRRKNNNDMALRIAFECNMSVATVYNRLNTAVKVVLFYATSKGLLQ